MIPIADSAMIVALPDPVAQAPMLPGAVAAILDGAGSDEALLRKVAEIAKRTTPGAAAEIDAKVAAILKAKADGRTQEMASWGLTDGWSGSGEIGAFASSGNTSNSGIALAGRLTRQGPRWKHAARSAIDYQQENGRTSKERYFAGYEGNISVSPGAYALITASYERDRFSGFNHRFAESVGFGYKVVDRPSLKMAFEGGPALRQTRFTNGVDDVGFAFRSAGSVRWDATPKLAFTQDASVYHDNFNTSVQSLAAATAKLNGALSARASFQLNTEANPPAGRQMADTTSRLTLVYAF